MDIQQGNKINKDSEQKLLLKIVETWRPNEIPEYRGFRCANCQQYVNRAWYHWLNIGDYRLPVHMCDEKCEPALQKNIIQVEGIKRLEVDRKVFGNAYQFSNKVEKRFSEIVKSWPEYKEAELKAFTCDECGRELDIDLNDGLRKGYHVWWKMDDDKTLAELHFHKNCANELGISP